MSATYTSTVRLPQETAERLSLAAKATGLSMNQIMQEAVAAHLDVLFGREDFRNRLREKLDRERAAIETLADY